MTMIMLANTATQDQHRAVATHGNEVGESGIFKILTEADLLQSPDPTWLVRDLLIKGTLAVLVGPPGIGKSFLALDLALSVASDAPFLGKAVCQGHVLYIAAEGVSGLKRRFATWKQDRGIEAVPAVSFIPHAVDLLHQGQVDKLLRSVGGTLPALVIVDTLARSMADGDENSAKDMGRFIQSLERAQREWGCAVLVVHHPGKAGSAERGSSALRAAADTMMLLQEKRGWLELTCDKQKDAAPFEPVKLELVPFGASCIIRSAASQGLQIQSTDRAFAILAENGSGKGLSRGDWLKLCQQDQMSESTFERARRQLVREARVRNDRRAYRAVDPSL